MTDTKDVGVQAYPRNRIGRAISKYKYVQILGGKCSVCGYNANLSALVFHHAGDKRVVMNGTGLYGNNHTTIMAELTQCELLCHNCHHELHNPVMNMEHIKRISDARDTGIRGRELSDMYGSI